MKKYLLILLFIGVFTQYGVRTAFANILYSQDISSGTKTTANSLDQRLGTGLSGTIGTLSMYFAKSSGTTAISDFRLYCYNSSAYSGADTCAGYSSGLVARPVVTSSMSSASKTLYTVDMYDANTPSIRYSFDPSKYYVIAVLHSAGTYIHYGSTADSYAGGICFSVSDCSPLLDLYFSVGDTESIPSGGLLSSVLIYTPDSGTVNTTDFTVAVSGLYNYVATSTQPHFDSLGLIITDLNTLSNYTDRLSIGTQVNSYNFPAITLPSNHAFNIRTYLYGSTTDVVVNSADVAYYTGTSTGLVHYTDANFSATSTPFAQFLNVPYLLSTKVPFAYFYQVKDLLININNASTSTIPASTFTININGATTTIEMFSTSTISHFISASTLSLLRTLMVAITYIGTAMFIYRRASSLM